MRLLRSLKALDNDGLMMPPSCLTIGNFDGLHLGHRVIINKVKEIASQQNLASAVLTFEPHPTKLLKFDQRADFRIFSNAQKIAAFREIELDFLLILPFNAKLRDLSAEEFVQKILLEKFNLRHLVIGHDFTFGKNRLGNLKSLENYDFELTEISPVMLSCLEESIQQENSSEKVKSQNFGQTISSTAIRVAIAAGELEKVKKLTGRRFFVDGLVVSGRKLAREIGFPTINLKAKPHIIKPKFGVYKTTTFIPHLQKKFVSITNFGIKPSVERQGSKTSQQVASYESGVRSFPTQQATRNEALIDSAPIFETYIPGFSQEIYDKKVFVEFEEFLRPEQKFSNLSELKRQIELDLKRIF